MRLGVCVCALLCTACRHEFPARDAAPAGERAAGPRDTGRGDRPPGDATRSDANKADANKADANKADANDPDASKPDVRQLDARKLDTTLMPTCDGDSLCDPGESCAAGCAACCGCHGVDCGKANVTCAGGGTLTTPAGSWKLATPQVLIPGPFALGAVPAGALALRVHLCELDLSKIGFTGTNPSNTSDKGAYVGFGVAPAVPVTMPCRPANGIWFEVTSTNPSSSQQLCQSNGIYSHDSGYRKYMFQTWFGASSAPSQLGQQYNVEKSVALGTKYSGADVVDLRLEVKASGSASYTYQCFSRLKLSSATVDGCPWIWNAALNNTAPDLAWVKFLKWPGGTLDFETAPIGTPSVSVHIWAFSGAASTNPAHVITWKSAAVEYLPQP